MDHDVKRVGVYLGVGGQDEAVGVRGEVGTSGAGERGQERVEIGRASCRERVSQLV